MMKDLSMHILDIVQNSIRAEAKNITVLIDENAKENYFILKVSDNGCGMTAEFMQNVRNPFTTSRTTRKVGLGIPMLEQTCIQCKGNLELESKVNIGTTITAKMEYNNIDRPPLGAVADSMYILIVTNPEIDFRYIHKFNNREFVIDTLEIKEILGEVSLTEPSIMQWIKENIEEGLLEIKEKSDIEK